MLLLVGPRSVESSDPRRDVDSARMSRRGDSLLGVHHHIEEHLVEQQWIAFDARQFLIIVSHDFDLVRFARGHSKSDHLLQNRVEADAPAA